MSNTKYGYAAAPEPDALQEQVEALEDAHIPIDRQYAEVVNPSHPDRPRFNALIKRATAGDTIAVDNLTALGSDLLDACGRAKKIEGKGVKIEILDLSGWPSQEAMMDAFRYMGNLFQTQRNLIPSKGKPRKAYPLGWRDGFRRYMSGESSGKTISSELGITDYDFYRMVRRYKNTIEKRKHKKAKQHCP